MHPQLEQMAHQSHVDDLRREAEEHRRAARLLRRRARSEARTGATVLAPDVRQVLVFAEHGPTRGELAQLLQQLQGLRDDVVTALVHHRPLPVRASENETGSHSLSLPPPPPPPPPSQARIPAQRGPSQDERNLADVLGQLRAAGHETAGELVAGRATRILAEEVRARHPEAVVLLTGRHRLAHLARRDMERRLRRQTSVPVIVVRERRARRGVGGAP